MTLVPNQILGGTVNRYCSPISSSSNNGEVKNAKEQEKQAEESIQIRTE